MLDVLNLEAEGGPAFRALPRGFRSRVRKVAQGMWPVAYLGRACAMSPPLGKSENIFGHDTLSKMGFQTYIFCSKVSSKCRKCRFRDPNFKMGFQTNIFCAKVSSKCRKCRFRDPNFKNIFGVACPRPTLQLYRHYGLPLTKILATPLNVVDYKNRVMGGATSRSVGSALEDRQRDVLIHCYFQGVNLKS